MTTIGQSMSWRKSALFGASIVLVASVLVLWRLVCGLDNVLLDQTVSPSGDLVARMYAIGEGNDPPYGQVVRVENTKLPWAAYFGATVFRGYCQHPSSLEWTGKDELAIRCSSFDAVRVRENRYRAVRIQFAESADGGNDGPNRAAAGDGHHGAIR